MDASHSHSDPRGTPGAPLKHTLPFFQHDLGEEELESLRKVLGGPILTTGRTVADFEADFSAFLGIVQTIGLTSCTAALHLALIGLGVGEGDEVITTPLTFAATSEAIIRCGAKPVFVDVEPDTGNIDASRIEALVNQKTKALLPVHLYGQMCDMLALRDIAGRHGLAIVEDCAHALEAVRDGHRPGSLSDAACFSFFATKNITCGEGGALSTQRTDLVQRMRFLSQHGMEKNAFNRFVEGYQHWDIREFGWKYNMSNIQAALLLPQLKRIDSNLAKRQRLVALYGERLSAMPGVTLLRTLPGTVHARHLLTIHVDPNLRDKVIHGLQQEGVGVVVNYRAIHLLTCYREHLGTREGDFPIAERIGNSTISLPLYPTMPEDNVGLVCDKLASVLKKL